MYIRTEPFRRLCSKCEPMYSLMTKVGPDGNTMPSGKRFSGPPNVANSVSDTPMQQVQVSEINRQGESGNNSRLEESELNDCPLLLKNECPHGLSGKKDGLCQYKHRQRFQSI